MTAVDERIETVDGEAVDMIAAPAVVDPEVPRQPPPVEPPRRRRILPAAVIAAAVLAGVVLKIGVEPIMAAVHGVVQIVSKGLPKPPVRTVVDERRALPQDALAGLPADVRAVLTEPAFQAGQGFSYLLSLPPSDMCAALAAEGLTNPGWEEVAGQGYQCLSDLVPVPGSTPHARPVDPDAEADPDAPPAPPPSPSTVFFMARGKSAEEMDVIRFKLNLDDPGVDAKGRDLLVSYLRRLAGPLAWSMPDAVEAAVRKHKRLLLRDRGVTVQVHPESNPVKRVNVTLLLTKGSEQLPTDRFVAAPAVPKNLVVTKPVVRDGRPTQSVRPHGSGVAGVAEGTPAAVVAPGAVPSGADEAAAVVPTVPPPQPPPRPADAPKSR